jgi:UDP-2,3-diacylglucosamine pyrophosphatase LpxH
MAQAHVERFALACRRAAQARGCDAVVTGHIHVPDLRDAGDGLPAYLNSGDWVDHGSALEYAAGAWSIVTWASSHLEDTVPVAVAAA